MTNPLDASRRRTLGQLSALSLATLSPWALRAAHAQKPITVGVIYVGPRDDFGYNQSQAAAAAEMKKMPGIKVVEEENVPETAAVTKTMTGMIKQDGASVRRREASIGCVIRGSPQGDEAAAHFGARTGIPSGIQQKACPEGVEPAAPALGASPRRRFQRACREGVFSARAAKALFSARAARGPRAAYAR